MLEYRRGFRRFHVSSWGALALLLTFSFLLQNVAGIAYYSLLMESSTAVSSPPVELQAGTAGNSTIYANKTSALVSVETNATGGADVEDYVDNNTGDVDNSTDVGTHSNFTAQQYGPDSINDTLTEGNTGGAGSNGTLLLNVTGDDETRTDWTRVGTNPYLDAIDYPTSFVNVSSNNKLVGDFNFTDSGKSTETIENVTVQLYARQSASESNLEVFVWNGSSWISLGYQLTSSSWSWRNWTATTVLDTWAKIDGAKIYIQSKTGDYVYEVDCARIKVDWVDPENFELDLEVQWTSADFDEANEFLCIYGGSIGAENITVDSWNGSGWENIFTDLNSGWNNVSVLSYLDSSNFTIRFKGGNETGDTTQNSWEIDAVLLHVWTGNEVLGSATTVSVEAKDRANSFSTQRAVLRTTDASNTLHVFLLDSTGDLQWYNSNDDGQTWDKSFTSTLSATSFSVEKDSSNNIHLVYDASGNVEYRKQAYNATAWGNATTLDSSGDAHQPSIVVAAYNQSWIYVVFDIHSTSGGKSNKVHFARSTDGGSTWAETSTDITDTLEYKGAHTAGTFPSIASNNTLETYGHIYATWFSGNLYLYLRRGVLGSSGAVTWDANDNVTTLSSAMSTASQSIDTNMMHSAVDNNGKYRVVYCESGTARYRDWNESSLSSPISLATVSNYPSLTYDSNNYLYVFYETNASHIKYDIRYQRSADTTPTSFNNAVNITDNNEGNEYVNTKIGGDNNRVEFVWTSGQALPFEVKYSYLNPSGGGQGDFNYVLKMIEKDGSNWKVRLKAYDNSSITRLDNCSIYIYNGSNSTQIVILNGDYENKTGPWYDLAASDTEYIWMHVETSSAGTSYVYVYLEILVPNKTVYARYVVAFEIN